MELRELDGKSSISLTNWQWEPWFDSMQATITAQSHGFAGTSNEVRFFRDALAAFVQALRQFTLKHEGEARLESHDPGGEAMVSVRRLDAAAHVLVEARVGHWLFHRNSVFFNSVSMAFELDPSQLPAIVDALTAILREGQPS